MEGPWHCHVMTRDVLLAVLQKLRNFESMTWQEIDRGGSHFIGVDQITPEARKRLGELRQDDVDDVYSLRISGEERFFGIRDGTCLRLLWWDPHHQVCPSNLKHT